MSHVTHMECVTTQRANESYHTFNESLSQQLVEVTTSHNVATLAATHCNALQRTMSHVSHITNITNVSDSSSSATLAATRGGPCATCAATRGDLSATWAATWGDPSATQAATWGDPSTTYAATWGDPSATCAATWGDWSATRAASCRDRPATWAATWGDTTRVQSTPFESGIPLLLVWLTVWRDLRCDWFYRLRVTWLIFMTIGEILYDSL